MFTLRRWWLSRTLAPKRKPQEHGARERQARAATMLGKSGSRKAVRVLIAFAHREILDELSGQLCAAAARALGDLKDPRAIPALGELLAQGQLDWVREAALRALEQIGDPSAIPFLLAAVRAPSHPETRPIYAVARALGWTPRNPNELVGYYLAGLPEPECPQELGRFLEALKSPEVVALLHREFWDIPSLGNLYESEPQKKIKVEILVLLGRIGTEAAIEELIRSLEFQQIMRHDTHAEPFARFVVLPVAIRCLQQTQSPSLRPRVIAALAAAFDREAFVDDALANTLAGALASLGYQTDDFDQNIRLCVARKDSQSLAALTPAAADHLAGFLSPDSRYRVLMPEVISGLLLKMGQPALKPLLGRLAACGRFDDNSVMWFAELIASIGGSEAEEALESFRQRWGLLPGITSSNAAYIRLAGVCESLRKRTTPP